jgi:tRNA modification GTPase
MVQAVRARIQEILASSARARIFREGISVVICGRPNVGKSSLLNAILKQERSIVTPVAGTTRDTIEEMIDMRGIPVKIVDTAGIGRPRDVVEKKAVQRARRYMDTADVVILVFDASRRLSAEDAALMRTLRHRKVIPVLNKTDLPRRINTADIAGRFGGPVEVSAKKLRNVKGLEDAIIGRVCAGNLSPGASALMSNTRHIQAVAKADTLMGGVLRSLENRLSLEFVAQDIRDALGLLDEILGARFSEDLLDRIFGDFCIGK